MRSPVRVALFIGLSTHLPWLASAAAQDPTYTVTGRVVERVNATWIGGATVRLSGRAPFITGPDGLFRFPNVTPGRQSLTVEAMGYGPHQRFLMVQSDTTVSVEMEVDPVRLDSLLVEAGTITLRGRVTDGETGRRIPEARVQAGKIQEAITNAGGSFRIRDLPRGHSIPILIYAYRYLPGRLSIITEEDTTLAIKLEPDSLGIRLFAAATRALEIRTAAVPLSVRALDRDFLERTPSRSVYDVIKWRNGGSDFSTSCLFIDEKKQFDTRILESYNASEMERIEMYRGSRMGFRRMAMVRVYTQEFVAKHLGTTKPFQKILFLPGGIGPDTCY